MIAIHSWNPATTNSHMPENGNDSQSVSVTREVSVAAENTKG